MELSIYLDQILVVYYNFLSHFYHFLLSKNFQECSEAQQVSKFQALNEI